MASDRDSLARENARLLAQAEQFASDDMLLEEAARWRDVTPEHRLVETWRLCAMVPRWRKTWPAEVQRRAAEPTPMSPELMTLLEQLKSRGTGGGAAG